MATPVEFPTTFFVVIAQGTFVEALPLSENLPRYHPLSLCFSPPSHYLAATHSPFASLPLPGCSRVRTPRRSLTLLVLPVSVLRSVSPFSSFFIHPSRGSLGPRSPLAVAAGSSPFAARFRLPRFDVARMYESKGRGAHMRVWERGSECEKRSAPRVPMDPRAGP